MPVKAVREGLFECDATSGAVFLLGSECVRCSRKVFPVAELCPYCGAGGTRTRRLPPQGRIELCTVIRQAPPNYTGPIPYGLAVVRLADDLVVIAPVETDRVLEPGTPVICTVRTVGRDEEGDAVVAYAFRTFGEGSSSQARRVS